MANPACQVSDGGGPYSATTYGVNVTPANVITVDLIDKACDSWTFQCITTDELSVAATVNAGLTVNGTTKQATFTAPVAGRTYRFESVVNNGVGPDGTTLSSYRTTLCIYTLTAGGYRVMAADETTEGHPDFGYLASVNALLRNPTALVAPGGADEIITSDGGGGLNAVANVKAGATYVSVGATPATAGGIRLAKGSTIASRNIGNTANLTIAEAESAADALWLGTDSAITASKTFDTVGIYAGTSVAIGVNGVTYIYAHSDAIKLRKPVIGWSSGNSPYGVHGEATIDMNDANYTAVAVEYACTAIIEGNATAMTAGRTLTLPDAAAGDSYSKWIWNQNGQTLTVRDVTHAAPAVAITAGQACFVIVTSAGVYRMTPEQDPTA